MQQVVVPSGHPHCERGDAVSGAKQLKVGLRVADLDRSCALWLREGLPVTLKPEDTGWARTFYGLDPDGYEVMFEQFA